MIDSCSTLMVRLITSNTCKYMQFEGHTPLSKFPRLDSNISSRLYFGPCQTRQNWTESFLSPKTRFTWWIAKQFDGSGSLSILGLGRKAWSGGRNCLALTGTASDDVARSKGKRCDVPHGLHRITNALLPHKIFGGRIHKDLKKKENPVEMMNQHNWRKNVENVQFS